MAQQYYPKRLGKVRPHKATAKGGDPRLDHLLGGTTDTNGDPIGSDPTDDSSNNDGNKYPFPSNKQFDSLVYAHGLAVESIDNIKTKVVEVNAKIAKEREYTTTEVAKANTKIEALAAALIEEGKRTSAIGDNVTTLGQAYQQVGNVVSANSTKINTLRTDYNGHITQYDTLTRTVDQTLNRVAALEPAFDYTGAEASSADFKQALEQADTNKELGPTTGSISSQVDTLVPDFK